MAVPLVSRKWFVAVGLRNLLLIFFTFVALIPILFLDGWIYSTAKDAQIMAVQEKHVLLAENVSRSLSMYTADLKAVFIAKSEAAPEPLSGELESLLRSVNIQMLALVDVSSESEAVLYCSGDKTFLPEAGIEALLTERRRAFAQPNKVVISPVIMNARQLPTLYMMRITRSGYLAVAAVNTAYFRQVQRGIVFGAKGHAAIVDQTGQAIAHPSRAWEETAFDMSQLKPVAMMKVQEKGFAEFYSPAMQAEMIAGFAIVPETGWGVMIPQPYSEIQARVRQTRSVALGMSLLGLLLAGVVSWQLTAYILGPIQAVTVAARALASGHRIDELKIKRHMVPKEVYYLLRTFDLMAEEVLLVRATLEQRVAERTQALVKEVERRKQLERQLIEQATHDMLTGLPNRRLLADRLQSVLAMAKRSGSAIAVFFLDLDGFKQVNDTYGHHVGDELLIAVAARLQANLRQGDSIFRLGGDEFVILAEQIGLSGPVASGNATSGTLTSEAMTAAPRTTEAQVVTGSASERAAEAVQAASHLSKKLLDTLRQPFDIQGREICIGGSIGIKISGVYCDETPDEVMASADDAMYKAKESGNCAIIDEGCLVSA
ncbi:MAG: diguanylate cyclase [Cyanobacteria bacterium J06607_13]